MAHFPECRKDWKERGAQDPATLKPLLDLLKEGLAAAESDAQRVKLSSDHQCGVSRTVLCLDQDGLLDAHQAVTPQLNAGDALTVLVLGWPKQVATSRVHVDFTARPNNESLLNPSTKADGGTESLRPTVPKSEVPKSHTQACIEDNYHLNYETDHAKVESRGGDASVLATATSSAASVDELAVDVVFHRDSATPDAGMTGSSGGPSLGDVTQRYEVDIDPGRYYVDLGVMVPFTVDRRIEAVADAVSGQSRLAVKYDARITPAFVVNMYLGGRIRGRIGSFGKGRQQWGRNFFGLQAGTGLDFANHPFQEFYLGLLMTPFSGASLSLGIALVDEQVFPKGVSDGMLLSKGATFAPETQFMPFPYLGFSVTLDFLDVIRAGYAAAAAPKN